jgi:hypothetical protein
MENKNGEALHQTAPAETAGHRMTVWATKTVVGCLFPQPKGELLKEERA